MRFLVLPQFVCWIMPVRHHVFEFMLDESHWQGRGTRHTLVPVLPNGDPLELDGDPQENPPNKRPPSLPDFPTDVPAPEPHDVPAWEPVDDPPPDTGEPEPKPRSIP